MECHLQRFSNRLDQQGFHGFDFSRMPIQGEPAFGIGSLRSYGE